MENKDKNDKPPRKQYNNFVAPQREHSSISDDLNFEYDEEEKV